MESKAKLLGHPVHPMLIVFPLGLLATSVIFDMIGLAGDIRSLSMASFWMIAAGLVSAILSAIFGLVDWLAIPDRTRAKQMGFWHGSGNGLVIVLFAISWILRRPSPEHPSIIALLLEVAGALIAPVTAWLGGELVDRLGMGVDDGAHLNAPNSLSGRPARGAEVRDDVKRAA